MTNGILAADSATHSDFLWNVHQYINNYIRFADTKAALAIGWATLIAGGLLKMGFYDRPPAECNCAMFFRYIGLGLLVAGAAFSIVSINPRLTTTQTKGYIFWENILDHGKSADYVAAVRELTPEEEERQIAQHLYDLSKVCQKKYLWVNRSILIVAVGTAWSGFFYLFR